MKKNEGYDTVKLPWFNPEVPREMAMIRNIIQSYAHNSVIFELENDQPCKSCSEMVEEVKTRFEQAMVRVDEKCLYPEGQFNIAVYIPYDSHQFEIRLSFGKRGEAIRNQIRHFTKVIQQINELIPQTLPVGIYIFSHGKEEDFRSISQLGNVHLCLRTSQKRVFLHLQKANLLVSSQNDFARMAAFMSSSPVMIPPSPSPQCNNPAYEIPLRPDGTFPHAMLKEKIDEYIRLRVTPSTLPK